MHRASHLVLIAALGASACGARPVLRSTVQTDRALPSIEGFKLTDGQCASVCGAPRAGEVLLWCHSANFTPSPDAGPASRVEQALVCNYGAS